MTLKERLLKLNEKGVKVAPVIEGPKFHFRRGGRFRAYFDNGEIEVHTGEAADIIKKMKALGCSVLQRLSERDWSEHYRISSHDPFNGERVLFGIVLDAHGEEQPLSTIHKSVVRKLKTFVRRVERILRDAVTVEFIKVKGSSTYTVLSAAPMVRSKSAGLAIAFDLVELGLIKQPEAICKVSAQDLTGSDTFIETPAEEAEGVGIPASPGVVGAKVQLSVHGAKKNEKFILYTGMTTPEEVAAPGLVGIVTTRGGYTSHAAIVARNKGIPCVVGLIVRNPEDKKVPEYFTVDGNRGLVFSQKIKIQKSENSPELASILEWAEEYQGIDVYANADTVQEIKQAISKGVKGIGLCRTEHMIAPTDRMILLQKALIVPDEAKRMSYLKDLYELQRHDFQDILKAAEGHPITIRLMDAPMHEVILELGQTKTIIQEDFGGNMVAMINRKKQLRETNPMLGHRGVRLGITFPDVYAMQIQAIMLAAREVKNSKPSIMVPMVSMVQEFVAVRGLIHDIWERLEENKRHRAREIPVGVMIETPRACVTADELAFHADFLSFGTNDLTQMAYGFSRDDIGKFLPGYLDRRILEVDPFVSLDERGIGRLIRMAIEMAREVDPGIQIGICGVHGEDPRSIVLCASMGMDYISCSPPKIQAAKLTVAQWTLRSKE